MPGYRIRPTTPVPDGALIVVRDITRPLPAPTKPHRKGGRIPTLEEVQPVCSHCGVQHFHKCYHIQLRAGSAIVSPTIWGNLQKLVDCGGFEFVNTVDDPPAQALTINSDGRGAVDLVEKVPQPLNAELLKNGHRSK